MNKLLQYMIGAGNVSDKYLPHLVKYQNRGEVKKSPLLDMSTLRPVYDNIPSPEKMLESYKPLDEVKALSKAYQIAQREIDALTIADRKARINASLKARKQPFSAKQLADETQAIGDKLRLFPNDPNSFIDDYLNPAVFIGNLASNLGRLPLNIQEGDYIDAAMAVVEPLAIGAYEAIGSPLIKKMFNKAASNVKFQAQRGLRRIVPGYVNKKMAAIDKGNQWTKDWYSNPIIKERYDNWVEKKYNYITPKEAAFQKQLIEIEPNLVRSINLDKSYANRLSGTIARDNYDKLLEQGFFTKGTTNRSSAFGANTTLARYAHGPNDALIDVLHPEFRAGSKNIANTTVHENIHAITKGDDGLTRNARTALTKPFAKAEDKFDKYLRKPTEVHARIGELRRQFRLTPEQVVDVNTMNRIMDLGLKGKTSVDKRWFELVKDKQSLRWLFNNAPVVAAPVAGAAMLDQKNNGGLVVDPRGQWAYPGRDTIVPTSKGRITMQGVPYAVYGEDETGYGQMMYPGGEYQFPGQMVYEKPMMQRGGPAPLYVSDTNDSRLKNYEDSLYNYNIGRRMAAVLDADKNLFKVEPGSPYDKALQAAVKGAGNKFIDNSETGARGYKNFEKVGSILKEYQRKGNKAILPIRYQGYFPDPDNFTVDLVTLRSVWDALGVTDPRPPGAAKLPQWKKPERQVIYKPADPAQVSQISRRRIESGADKIPVNKYPPRPAVYKRDPPQLATVEQRRAANSMGQPVLPQLSPNLFTQNNMSKSRAVDFWNPSMPGGIQNGWHRRLFGSMEEADNFMKFIRENNLSQGYEVTNSGVNNDADRVSYTEGGENEEDPKTLMKKKLVGKVSTPMGKVNLRPIFPKFKTIMENLYDPNCPDGIGCSRQATRFAQKITGLPYQSYAPADATFRDAVAERQGLKNLFDQTGDLRRNADSHQPNWKYPTKTDFDKWKAGDIVTLDAGVDVFNYSPPAGYTWDDASQASHNGVVVGFTETGRPIIKHGYASGPNRGKSYTEVLGPDNRLKDLGHGRYAVKSVWRPKEIDDAGNINRVAYIAEPGEQRAARKQSTSANYSYFLNPTEEEKMVREQPVAAQTSGAANRLQTKQSLINMFNNEQLDKELQYKLGMTAEEVNRMKPVIFGVVGQESRFNDIDNPAASLKEVIGSVLGRGSRGAAQIKLSSLTKDERKVLGINRSKDLEKEDVAYKAAMLLLNNARKRMNQEVVEGTHPELVDKDEYFRSGYYYNAPARAINSAKSWGDRPAPVQILNPLTWANRFTSRRRPRPFSSENPGYDTQNELRMDKGSYPWKLMQQAKDLGVRVDFDKGQDLEEVVIRGARPGSTFERFSKGGQHGGLDRWFAEKWVDVKTGKDCGRQEGEKRGYPACRPSKRVSSETPKTSSEMSSAEKAKFKRTKTSSERIPYNHKRK
jgi:hypothetical protein